MNYLPVLVLNTTTKREHGYQTQLNNIQAARAISEIIRTCLGPRAMLKMVLDAMGGIQLTNDGNSILREIDVAHPAAKSMIELSKTQDENVGDGTTSVIVLAGEILAAAEPWLQKKIHPLDIIRGFYLAMEDALEFTEKHSRTIDITKRQELLNVVASAIGTKFSKRYGDLVCGLATDAVTTVVTEDKLGNKDIDLKRLVRVEKVPGGEISDSRLIRGVMLNKDVTHASMRRRIENPRVILLDCPLEYKKAESQMVVDVRQKGHFQQLLEEEEKYVIGLAEKICKFKPDLVLTEKGLSDLAQHIFVKHGVTALRRVRGTDNLRVARATGATIVNRPDELKESDVGRAGLYEVRKIGDEYFSFIENCDSGKACSILLRGPNKDALNEIERNLMDALHVVKNVVLEPKLVPGGGAIETAIGHHLNRKSQSISGVQQWTYRSIATAFEVIPRTLAQNCGAKTVQLLTELRAKHATDPEKNFTWGINGNTGALVDVNQIGVWEPLLVKTQTIKTAIESACMLLRVDDVVSGIGKKPQGGGGGAPQGPDPSMME